MSNLAILERMLGSLDLWPRDINQYLFLVSPTPYTIHEVAFVLRKRYAFSLSVRLCEECSGTSPTSETLASLRYINFAFRTYEPYSFEYYDMNLAVYEGDPKVTGNIFWWAGPL